MGYKTVSRGAWLAVLLVMLNGGQVFAQFTGQEDEGTAKRNYGDPLPSGEGGGSAPGSPSMTIIEAARSGGVDGARGAFLAGESVNSRTPRGAPAVLIAAQAGNIAVLRFLLEKNANPNLFDKSTGKTALIAAAELGDSGMTHLLLEHKADPDHQDRQGETALIKAARIGAADTVALLLGAKANVNATDYAGHSATWHAQESRHDKIAKMIQTAGGN